MEITIRRALLTDAKVLATIARQTFHDTFTGTCTEEDMQSFLDRYFNLNQVQAELMNAADNFYLVFSGDQLVAYMRFMEDYDSFPYMKKWKALELKRIYVDKAFHGQGIAQQLMDFFMAYAHEHAYEAVWLGVWEHNQRAQKFYGKYGFENSGHTHDFPIGNTPQTDHWLWKFLV